MIKPLEKKDNKRTTIFLKAIFLLTLIITGILIDKIFLNKKTTSEKPQVLGEEKKIEKPKTDFFQENIKKTEEKIIDFGEQVLGEASSFVKNTQEKVASSVSDIIYRTSLEPIVNQIEKLPKDQQEKIKDQVCK
ncbi:MAG: hypothetical protein N2593_00145 [Patescibacteria group bacterium]|nr:hypothetical protein [Patescibacteria group bacterium]